MFNKILRQLRKDKNMTQEDLGKIIGVSDRTLGYYESGDRFPPENVLQNIANYFEVSLDYLLGKSQVKETSKDLEDIEEKLPNGIKILRRATKELSEDDRKRMIRLMSAFVEDIKNTKEE